MAQSDAFELATAIQQFDSEGTSLVQTPNARSLQVLASMDFYTTFGTGKMGGRLFPGTVTDVGHVIDDALAATRIPAASSDAVWRVEPRAYTEGQAGNSSRASLSITMLTNTALASVTIDRPDGTSRTFLEGTDWALGGSISASVSALAAAINASTAVNDIVVARDLGSTLTLVSLLPGEAGSGIIVRDSIASIFQILAGVSPVEGSAATTTRSPLVGGVDLRVNAGDGSGQLGLVGMTERLPLGVLLQDSDFLGEDPLADSGSGFSSSLGAIRPLETLLPLDEGREYTRLVGGAGQWIGMADGSILSYTAYDENTAPTGTRSYRLNRGASAYVLSEPRPGGPIDWFAGSFPGSLQPVLKGGVLAGKALLVRNFHETAFSSVDTTSHGGELQMVILTQGVLGQGVDLTSRNGISVNGIISPTGYGEGYAAADRYRLEGQPLVRNNVTTPIDPAVELAVFSTES